MKSLTCVPGDIISNTGVHVVSIATNFNGLTNLVRAGTDSTYYLDEGLRLWGTSSVGSATPGMDMNYNHNFEPGPSCTVNCGGGSGNIAERMVFTASPDTSIRVFDTFFFNQQKKISIRDPIIGPLRVAFDATSGQQYLFGITARGLVVVSLPTITTTNPQGPPRPWESSPPGPLSTTWRGGREARSRARPGVGLACYYRGRPTTLNRVDGKRAS